MSREGSATRIIALLAAFLAAFTFSSQAFAKDALSHFIFVGGSELSEHEATLERSDIAGAQVIYPWRALEAKEGDYTFEKIERDLSVAERLGKHLFIQVQDRFFLPTARNLPDYILTEPAYGGGLVRQSDNPGEGKAKGEGWVAAQWNPAVRARFQALLTALGERFDGRVYGINLPESSIEVATQGRKAPDGFTCDTYVDATLENAAVAKAAFPSSHVVQYVNFWPCEWNDSEGYMSRTFAWALEKGVGLGGPDIIPYRRGQIKNSYPFFARYGDKLDLVAMAVQGPTLTYTNPKTGQRFTRAQFEDYAVNDLRVDIIFWSVNSPWIQDR